MPEARSGTAGRTPRRTLRLSVLAVGAALLMVLFVSLGTWQVQRLAWKENLIAAVTSRMSAAPVPAPSPGAFAERDPSTVEYQQVAVSGHYLNDREAHVIYSLTEPKGPVGGVGYMVMTPFQTDDGWIVYVNRGFVPAAKADPSTRPQGLVEGETTVTGVVRLPAEGETLELHARVLRVEEARTLHRYGAELVDVDVRTQERLYRLVMRLQREELQRASDERS